MVIRIFVTGGTFDKEYDELTGELFFKDTHLPDILKTGRCTVPLDIRTIMMIDSLSMKPSDRKIILENVKKEKEERIIITHGTDTIADTAKVLGKAMKKGQLKGKTVVLTGAMRPWKLGRSDCGFNLGSAIAWVQCKKPGVYIAMNGKVFDWDNVRKNKQKGEFETLK